MSDLKQMELPELISSAEGSRANLSAAHRTDVERPSICGQKCSGYAPTCGHDLSLRRMCRKSPLIAHETTCDLLDIPPTTEIYRRMTQGQTIREIVGGLLHTPTTKANFLAPSMQKWPSCRRFVMAFGGQKIMPEQFEFLMGYPIGWTDLKDWVTPSSRKSRK